MPSTRELIISDRKFTLDDKFTKQYYTYVNSGDTGRGDVRIETPILRAPFGLSPPNPAYVVEGSNRTYSLALALSEDEGGYGDQTVETVDEFANLMRSYDDTAEQFIRDNAKNIVAVDVDFKGKKAVTADQIIDFRYSGRNRVVNVSRDAEGNPTSYPDKIQFKIKYSPTEGFLGVKFIDADNKPLDVNETNVTRLFAPNCRVRVLAKCYRFFFLKSGYQYKIQPTLIQLVESRSFADEDAFEPLSLAIKQTLKLKDDDAAEEHDVPEETNDEADDAAEEEEASEEEDEESDDE